MRDIFWKFGLLVSTAYYVRSTRICSLASHFQYMPIFTILLTAQHVQCSPIVIIFVFISWFVSTRSCVVTQKGLFYSSSCCLCMGMCVVRFLMYWQNFEVFLFAFRCEVHLLHLLYMCKKWHEQYRSSFCCCLILVARIAMHK